MPMRLDHMKYDINLTYFSIYFCVYPAHIEYNLRKYKSYLLVERMSLFFTNDALAMHSSPVHTVVGR
jgi:hypothetical protein